MVFNKRDLARAFSPSKIKRPAKKRISLTGARPSTSGSTVRLVNAEDGSQTSQTSIKVIVRVRPENDREMQDNCRTAVKVVDDRMLIFDPKLEDNPFYYHGIAQKGRDLLKKQNKELQFIFDRVFDKISTNQDVFEGSTKDLISSLLDGYNCSVFAYGATGAGKTHTMLGSPNDPGITYRTVAELFYQVERQADQREFNLGVTYLEIYNENVQDLLHKSGPLHLRDDGRCGVVVAGLKIIQIQNAEELMSLLAKGNRNRTQHPTDANEESSRSHAVFQVYVNMTNKLDGQVKQVKLSMIDLAGSERATATGCKGIRFKEGANINKSLLALGNCINNLADGAKHVTYRDSKLTRLLKDSLGGNCQTVMIANVAPSSFSYEDTYNTLRYANRAKKIKTHIKKNIISCEMHVTTYIRMVEEQKKEIDYLKQKVLALESNTLSSPSTRTGKETTTDVEPDKNTIPITNRLIELIQRKKALNEKVLSLESSDKILCCRIQYKKAADERLRNLAATVDNLSPNEYNASGKSRLNKSLLYFTKQRDSIRIQLEVAWDELCSVETELEKLSTEIRSKGLESVYDKVALQNCQLEKSRAQQQYEHAKKVGNLQLCEMQSIYTIMKMLSGTLQNYYNMMMGYGTMTDSMKEEFKQLIKSLEGVRNIKWSDIDSVEDDEQFYGLTRLSVSQVADPLKSQIPIYTPCQLEEESGATIVKENLNTTFDRSPPRLTNGTIEAKETNEANEANEAKTDGLANDEANPHNTTITIKENSKPVLNETEVSKETFNRTVSLTDNRKKRVLSDKNNINGRTPPKQAKKVSPPQKGVIRATSTPGKENKHSIVQRPRVAVAMNAKSMAILNKIKADKLKALPLTKESSINSELTDGGQGVGFKAVREKERRGLMMTHPYQKPNARQKFAPGRPSSRVPW